MTVADERADARTAPWSSRIRERLASAPRSTFVAVALLSITVAVGAAMRFWDLGSRAFHHDESLHATFSWYLVEGRGYEHNPLMHGPFLFHTTAAGFFLFGDSDTTARLVPALMGTVLIAMSWLLRDRIGTWGVVALGLFLAFSPTLLYFSRFLRNDIYIAVWTLGLVVAIWRYVDGRQMRYLVAAAALMALSFATKETTFITIAVFVLFFNGWVAWQLGEQTCPTGGVRERDGRPWTWVDRGAVAVAVAPLAWVVVALWPLIDRVRGGMRWSERTAPMDVLLILGTFTLPQFSAAIQVPLEGLGVDLGASASAWFGLDPTVEARIGLITVATLLVLTATIGLMWNWRVWALSAVAFYLTYFTLYTTFYTNVDGLTSGIWGSLDYWLAQQEVQRGAQPWFYYLMVLPVYEFLPLLVGLAAAVPVLIRGSAFMRFVLFWFVGTLVGLSFAGEKMPWLTVHLVLPIAVLGAYAVDRAIESWRLTEWPAGGRTRVPARRAWVAAPAAVALLALGALTFRAADRASFENADVPNELLIYTQTSRELVAVRDRIEEYAASTGAGRSLPIYIDNVDGFSWPWAWYLRDYDSVTYTGFEGEAMPQPGSIVLVADRNAPRIAADPRWTEADTYAHRWWFPEFDTYKAVGGFGDFVGDLTEAGTWRAWWDYFYDREQPEQIGRTNAVLFIPVSGEGAP